jgi:hypothetical protein
MCSKEQVLNPVNGKCVKKTSETGKLIQYYNWYINMDRGSNALYENSNDIVKEVKYSFYSTFQKMSKFELLTYLSDLGLKKEGKHLLAEYPDLRPIDIDNGVDPIETLLEEFLSEPSQKGHLYETLWDIFIKIGVSKFGNDYYHILGNVNIDREDKYLRETRPAYENYFKKLCISGNETGVSDFSLKLKTVKDDIDEESEPVACEGKKSNTIDNIIYGSCKYYTDDDTKRITEYDLQNILSVIKNKYQKQIRYNEPISNFEIYLFVKDKSKVHDLINRANRSSEYLKKNIRLENILDVQDLKKTYWEFYNFINDYRKHIGRVDNNIFTAITKDIKKPSLKLRFHQEYAIQKTIKNIGRTGLVSKTSPINIMTHIWGMVPRSGKTFIAGGFIKEFSRIYTNSSTRVLIITSAPTETKTQWEEVFTKHNEFDNWDIEYLNSTKISKLIKKSKDGRNLVYIASKQYLDVETEDEFEDPKKLAELKSLSKDIDFNLIIFDENHLGGTTDKAKKTLELFGDTKVNKILLTATFNKSLNRFPDAHLIMWDLNDITLCKQFNNPRKLMEFLENHKEDEKLIKKILFDSYGINYDYCTKFNKNTNGILENYYEVKGADFIKNLYISKNAKIMLDDLSIYPDIDKVLLEKYNLDLDDLSKNIRNDEETIHKCEELSITLQHTLDDNDTLMKDQDTKIKIFSEMYTKFPDIHFIGLNFVSDKLKQLLESTKNKDNPYTYSVSELFKYTGPKGNEIFENGDAIDSILNQIAGVGSDKEHIPSHKSIYGSIRMISAKNGSRTLQDGYFTSQLWFIPYGKRTPIEIMSRLLKDKLNNHPGFKDKYYILSLNDDLESDGISEYIKSKEIEAKKSGKKGMIILSGQKLQVGISLKCVDIVILLNNVKSNDTLYQSMFRALTESTNKKMGFVVDLNPLRVFEAIYQYSIVNNTNGTNVSYINKINQALRNMLFYVDDHLFEYDDSIERSNKIIDIINTLIKDNPIFFKEKYEQELKLYIDNIDFTQYDEDFFKYLNRLKIDEKIKKRTIKVNPETEELPSASKKEASEVAEVAEAAEESPKKSKPKKENPIIKSELLIPFINLFVVLTIDDEKCVDLVCMYKILTSKEDLQRVLFAKLEAWGIKKEDRKQFLEGFGNIIKSIYKNDDDSFIINAVRILRTTLREVRNTSPVHNSNDNSRMEGGSSNLSFILNNIQKINISYEKFNHKLQRLGYCKNSRETAFLYSKFYLSKYDYIFK